MFLVFAGCPGYTEMVAEKKDKKSNHSIKDHLLEDPNELEILFKKADIIQDLREISPGSPEKEVIEKIKKYTASATEYWSGSEAASQTSFFLPYDLICSVTFNYTQKGHPLVGISVYEKGSPESPIIFNAPQNRFKF